MNLLIDTMTLLIAASTPERLTSPTRAAINDRENLCFLSDASVWELTIKAAAGKLAISRPVSWFVAQQVDQLGLSQLAIALPHILAVESLPLHHRDPFDRLLIAQAMVEDLTIVTGDRAFSDYAVPVLW